MYDPNREDFNARILRLRREHSQGRGFEAGGVLSRADFRRPRLRARPVLRAGLFLLAFAFGMKGALHAHLGADGYALRVAEVTNGAALASVQTVLLSADPATLLVSETIDRVKTSF